MKLIRTRIDGLFIIKPKIFGDQRGYFFESFQAEKLRVLGISPNFVQDNESLSAKGVLRGLHFQYPPHTQGKLVRVVKGSVMDVAVDLRKNSSTYGKWESMILSGENKLMVWIPKGFAHGFLTLEDDTIFQYKCTGYYNMDAEGAILWNDPILSIPWTTDQPDVSEKDSRAVPFRDFKSPF